MKKHNCRRNHTEMLQHEAAVKIRKMTDAQICEFVEGLQKPADLKESEMQKEDVQGFLSSLKPGAGIGQATIAKLHKIAMGKGLIPESEGNNG